MSQVRRWGFAIIGLAILAGRPIAQQAAPAAVMLESANQKASLEGDLRGAIKIYQDVVARFSKSDRAAVATAMLKMAECYERLGDPQASKILEQLVAQYADQAATAATAKARLSSGMPRIICEECGDPFGSVSPDGRFMGTVVPFMGASGETAGDIGLLDLANRKTTLLKVEGSGKRQGVSIAPVFSPDSRQLVYTWNADSTGLRIVPREPSGKMRALPNPAGYSMTMALGWAKSGILALGQRPDQMIDLILVNPADGTQRVLKSMRYSMSPGPHVASLSADGRFVTYEQMVNEPPSFINIPQGRLLDRQIHVLALDGSSDVAITTGSGVKQSPEWTPNGSHVLYISNVAGAWDLWATPMRDGKVAGAPVLVKKNLGAVWSVGVTSSGIYHFYEGRTGIFRTMIASVVPGATPPSPSLDGFVGTQPTWSPDGKLIAINRPTLDRSAESVIVRTLATGDERVFRRDGLLGGFPAMWFPDGTGLLVQVREGQNSIFWYRIEVATGEFRKLVQQRGNPEFWTHQNVRTLSADGRTLFFGTYANQKDSQLDRITALNLTTGAYRDVVRLTLDKDSLPTAAQDFALAASPDGRSLAIMHADHKLKAAHLAVVGVDGQGYRELVQPIQASNLRNKLVWSRDGKWIYFTTTAPTGDDVHRVMRIAATGGKPEPVGADIEGLERFDLNPAGDRIAYSTLRPEGWGELLWSLDVSWLMKAPR